MNDIEMTLHYVELIKKEAEHIEMLAEELNEVYKELLSIMDEM